MGTTLPKRFFRWVYGIALVLLITSYLIRYYELGIFYWVMRIVIVITFLLLILYSTSLQVPKVFILFFLAFIAGTLFALQFDKSPYDTLYMIFNIIGIFLLFFHISRFFDYKKMNLILIVSFFMALLLNGYFVYELVKAVSSYTLNSFHHILFFISGSSILLLLFAALFYNHVDSSKRSMNFVVFSFLFIFYHIFLVMGHYGIGYATSTNLSISRVLLILSFVFLYRYLIFYHESIIK